MHRSKVDGLAPVVEGVTQDPDEIDRRIVTLLPGYPVGKHPERAAIGFVVGMLTAGDPIDMLEDLHEMIAYLARYLRQPIPVIEAMGLDEARRYVKITSGFIRAESGKEPEADPTDFDLRPLPENGPGVDLRPPSPDSAIAARALYSEGELT